MLVSAVWSARGYTLLTADRRTFMDELGVRYRSLCRCRLVV